MTSDNKQNTATIKHCLDHERGTIRNLKQGENWFNMLYGVFHEPEHEIRTTGGHTGVCFEINGDYMTVKNHSEYNPMLLSRAGETDFVEHPRLKMHVLQEGDRIQVMYPNEALIEEEMVLEYHRKEAQKE